MGLQTWTDAPQGKIQKFDVVVPNNYLTESELAQLSRLVNAHLDVAESMVLDATDRRSRTPAKLTAEIAKTHAESDVRTERLPGWDHSLGGAALSDALAN